MKKMLSLLLVLVFVVSSVSVISFADDSTTLTVWIVSTNLEKTYFTDLFDMWQEETGNKIDLIGLPDQHETPLTKFTTGDIPDVFFKTADSSVLNFNPAENFVDWSDAAWISDMPSATLGQAQYNGQVVGLPCGEASTSGCLYNKVIFEELGLAVPTTIDEFMAVCDKLLENGIQPIYLPSGDAWAIFQQFGIDAIFDEHPEYMDQLNSNQMTYADIPEMRAMCEWYKNAAEKGYFGDAFASDKWDYNSEVLGTGEAAMLFCWDTWMQVDYDNESYDYKCDDFGLMPVFTGTREKGNYEGGNLSVAMVNKNGENVEAAKDLINFMADPENYNIAYDGIATSAIYNGMTTNAKSSQYLGNKDSIDTLTCCSSTPKIIGYNANQHGQCIVRLMLGEIDVDECLKAMDDERIATLKTFE